MQFVAGAALGAAFFLFSGKGGGNARVFVPSRRAGDDDRDDQEEDTEEEEKKKSKPSVNVLEQLKSPRAPLFSPTGDPDTDERRQMAKELQHKVTDGNLEGKVAVVTGSTSGIGLAIARRLAKEGVRIVLHGSRHPSHMEDIIRELVGRTGTEVMYVQSDLSKLPAGAEKIINEAVRAFGSVDILVNNAGVQHVAPCEEFAPEQWDRVLAINLSSAFHMTRLALPLMKRSSGAWGRIINVSSVHGLVASVNKAAYVSAKHGMNGLTKVVALETAAETTITCNAVCPGWVWTPLVEPQVILKETELGLRPREATKALVGQKQPRPIFTSVKDVAELTLFLCTEAASNITGSEFAIDGGWRAQ